MEDLKGINENEPFQNFLKKEEITFVVYLGPDTKTGNLRFVTTSNDGFIKWNEVDLASNKFTCKKSLFVCQSGISVACQLSGEQSFALAGKNNDIYIFSF